jgi:hypothetical protein
MNERAFVFTPDALVRIRSHARRGLDAGEIAFLLGCDAGVMTNICARHGIEIGPPLRPTPLDPDRRPSSDHRLSPQRRRERRGLLPVLIEIARGADSALVREAAKRGTTPAILAARLIEIVAADDLFTALMDH